jgi:large subunit ribosomal protein L21
VSFVDNESASGGNRRTPIYAIVRSGGRQYRVEPNQTLDVDLLHAEIGSKVDLNVLLLGGDGDAKVGTPLVDGAKVVAEVIEHLRGDKIRIFKYKNKTRRRQRMGHRQDLTRLHVTQIVTDTGSVIQVEKPKRQKKAAPEPEAAVETAVEVLPEADVEEAPKPRRARAPKVEAEAAPETEAGAAPEVEASEESPVPKPRTRRSKAAPEPAGEDQGE